MSLMCSEHTAASGHRVGVGGVRKMRSELGGLRLCRAVPGLQLSEMENRS